MILHGVCIIKLKWKTTKVHRAIKQIANILFYHDFSLLSKVALKKCVIFQVHGSKEGGVVDAIQIETPEPILLQERHVVLRYAISLAQAIVRFYRLQNNGGSKETSISAVDLCSRPRQHLGLFYSCLFCSQSFPSQNVHCIKQYWKPYRFNRVLS